MRLGWWVVDDVARTLYALPPEEFVAARDAAVRAADGRERTAAIAGMRKPTVAAWLVNLIAIHRPELLAGLAALAGELRAAQRELRGSELRSLSTQRRATVAALVEEARRLAIEAKPALGRGTGLPLAEVESTLQAALAEPEAADLVRSGRLVRAIEYAGFGEVPRPQLRLITSPVPDEGGEPEPVSEAQLTAARTAESVARGDLDRAMDAERDGARELAEVDAALAELHRRRSAAEEELSRRKLARKTAERSLAAARRLVGEAEAALADRGAPRPKPGRRTG